MPSESRIREPLPKLLILGASGLLGAAVSREAGRRPGTEVHLVVFRGEIDHGTEAKVHRVDLRNRRKAEHLLKDVRPDVVINCAGIVKSQCNDAVEARLVNTLLPHLAAATLQGWGGRLVQVSTDCVYSGKRGRYSEEDLPDPVDLYGRTKLAGEVYDPPHLTVRTSFVGLERVPSKGLLGWFFHQSGEVQGYHRCIWSGVTTLTLARILLDLAARQEVVGLLHLAGEAIDKATLLQLVAEVFEKKDVTVRPVEVPVCDRSLRSLRVDGLGLRIPAIRPMLEDLARDWKDDKK